MPHRRADTGSVLYESEVVRATVNPSWVPITWLSVDRMHLFKTSVILRVFAGQGADKSLFDKALETKIVFADLFILGKSAAVSTAPILSNMPLNTVLLEIAGCLCASKAVWVLLRDRQVLRMQKPMGDMTTKGVRETRVTVCGCGSMHAHAPCVMPVDLVRHVPKVRTVRRTAAAAC